jgi:5,6-dimethylbenzimidazole synthase
MQDQPFDERSIEDFSRLLRWRRDVRHFKPDPVDPSLLKDLLEEACLAPSVGRAQPWRFVVVREPGLRAAVMDEFQRCRDLEKASLPPAKQGAYGLAKLEGLRQAPVHLAVFTDRETLRGYGLGRHHMPETLDYSTVMAVHSFWLAARLRGLGTGWVSILDPAVIHKLLRVPDPWHLTAYLCVGWPSFQTPVPDLELLGWEGKRPLEELLLER